MAFQVPSHLPRQAFPGHGQSLSSSSKHYDDFLAKVGQVSREQLDSSLASSWVHELTGEIDSTRSSLRSKINASLPEFERQLQSSKDVVARVNALATDTDNITVALYDQQHGLLPAVKRRVAKQADLSQRAKDAAILSAATIHAVKCRDALEELSKLVQDARLAETVAVSGKLKDLIHNAPEPLPRANIFVEIKNRFRVLHDSVQEQLADAYARAIIAQSLDNGERLSILQSVSTPQKQHRITLCEILSSLTAESATQCITSLGRTILTKFIEPTIFSEGKVSVNGSAVLLELGEFSSDTVVNLSSLIEFLKEHLFGSLPSQYCSQMIGALIPQLQSLLLEHLKRSIPSQVTGLPQYISLVEHAIAFEATMVQANAPPTGSTPLGRPINDWAAKTPNHYEKKRCELILQDVRNILCDENQISGLQVVKPVVGSKVAEELGTDGQLDVGVNMTAPLAPAERVTTSSAAKSDDEEDGWGFDDFGGEEETEVKDLLLEETAEEPDPWDDDPWDNPFDNEPTVTKSAKGLEKFSSKSKGSSLDSSPPKNGSVRSMNGSGPQFSLPSTPPSHIVPSPVAISRPHELPESKNKETFLVSECAQAIVKTLRAVVQEGQDLARARLFPPAVGDASQPIGSLLTTSITSILDLFRALVPVVQAEMMAVSPALRIRFANDCTYLAANVSQLATTFRDNEALFAKLADASERLATVGEQWLDECLERQKREIITVLGRAKGFLGTGDDTQYAIDQSVADHVIETISTFAQDWKGTLAPSAYLAACGFIVEETISSVLNDILSLPDIPELESRRLSLLCKRLDVLKDLFIFDAGKESSVGSYVPSWFKFAYLAELLEASLADIAYLVESEALIDFGREELVRLVEGLFSDTPLRAKTIQKIRTEIPAGMAL